MTLTPYFLLAPAVPGRPWFLEQLDRGPEMRWVLLLVLGIAAEPGSHRRGRWVPP
jgi:hypothetical protein